MVVLELNTLHEIIFKKQDNSSNVSCYIDITVTLPLRKYLFDRIFLGKASAKV